MNKERLLQLAAFIEAGDYTALEGKVERPLFDMRYELYEDHACGTAMCIAGFAACLFTNEDEFKTMLVGRELTDYRHHRVAVRGGQVLELTDLEMKSLFYPREFRGRLFSVTKEMAASVLREFANTGEIRWPDTEHDPL